MGDAKKLRERLNDAEREVRYLTLKLAAADTQSATRERVARELWWRAKPFLLPSEVTGFLAACPWLEEGE